MDGNLQDNFRDFSDSGLFSRKFMSGKEIKTRNSRKLFS